MHNEVAEPMVKNDTVVILRPDDPQILNNQYKRHTQACMDLIHEIDLLPGITSVEDYNFVQGRLREINKSYLVKVENRKKISRILDLGISHLMEGEKLIGARLAKWRETLIAFQQAEKRKADEKIRQAQALELKLKAIANGVKQCQLALEGIVLSRKKSLVTNIDQLFEKVTTAKSLSPLSEFIHDGVSKERDTMLNPIFNRLPEEIREEVKNQVNRCQEYGLLSFTQRIESELDNMIVGCIGNPDMQDKFAQEGNAESFKLMSEQYSSQFKMIYPELNKVQQGNIQRIEVKAATAETRAALGTIAAKQPDIARGVTDSMEAVIKTREQFLQALNYYLDKTGPDGLTRVFNSVPFVFSLLNKEQPPLPGVSYQEKRKISLR